MSADLQYNMTPGITPISQNMYDLHMGAFWVCVGIGVVVFSVMIYSMIMHRKSRGFKAATFHEHPGLEFIWALIPFFILIGLAIPATTILIRMQDTNDAEINIKVTGYQWRWKYEYLDQGISFFSNLSTPMAQRNNKAEKGENYLLEVDNELVIPVHKKVRFLITSNDVIHSWWVPALGIKTDAIPGFIRETWASADSEGTYRGQCAELCGAGHGFMPIVVNVKSVEDFNTWLTLKTNGKITKIAREIPLPAQVSQKPVPAATTTATKKPETMPRPSKAKALWLKLKGIKLKLLPHSEKTPEAGTQAPQKTTKEIKTITKPASQQAPTQPAIQQAPAQPQPQPAAPTPTPSSQTTTQPVAQDTAVPSSVKMSKSDLMAQGKQIYEQLCAVCHQVDGSGQPPLYPALTKSTIVVGPLRAHIDRVVNGKPGTAMQAFGQQISDDQIAAVITYERNALGNNVGDIVQPGDVTKAHQKS